MHELRFVYVSYIAATPQALWQALIDGETTRRYWHRVESSWQIGAPLTLWEEDGRVDQTGTVLVCDPPRKLAYTCQQVSFEAGRFEKPSRVSLLLEPVEDGIMRLTLTHDDFEPGSVVYAGITRSWPAILCGLKSLLETGSPLPFMQLP
ncbi:SRPBCC family protein [Crenobacter sp. SG2305]|uniref:SRPBCC family protein n=1 Tax=Crenobacter oryzisoli TaxID=3056844 RepID=UPI0025AACD35|nr:SRPBCC family protein [Crenobacter sp. SG2305]MDN0081736.1 SRPBCC family protein [Crenobacter sp. SG2305]